MSVVVFAQSRWEPGVWELPLPLVAAVAAAVVAVAAAWFVRRRLAPASEGLAAKHDRQRRGALGTQAIEDPPGS